MATKFVSSDTETIVVSLKFEDDDTPCIYYDHICVAYISDDGGIRPLPFETGEWYVGGTDDSYVKYLLDKGVKLVREKTESVDRIIHHIEVAR